MTYPHCAWVLEATEQCSQPEETQVPRGHDERKHACLGDENIAISLNSTSDESPLTREIREHGAITGHPTGLSLFR